MITDDEVARRMLDATADAPDAADRIADEALRRGRIARRRAGWARAAAAAITTFAVILAALLLVPGPSSHAPDSAGRPSASPSVSAADDPLRGVQPADPSTVTVSILNSTDSVNLAHDTALRLLSDGFLLGYLGDYDSCGFKGNCPAGRPTIIQYSPGQESGARALLDRFPTATPRLETLRTRLPGDPLLLTLILGDH